MLSFQINKFEKYKMGGTWVDVRIVANNDKKIIFIYKNFKLFHSQKKAYILIVNVNIT